MTVNLATTDPNATGLLTSQGLGTGLNISSLVSALVNAQVQPQQTSLQAQQTADQATISALGTVKSALSSLQNAINAITTGSALNQLSAQSSNSSVFTAAAGAGAAAGAYQVQVQTLAQGNILQSSSFSGSTATVPNGPYTISAGGSSFSVTLTSSNNTLAGLAAAINGASGNNGVSATVVNGSGGSYLLLSATQTGTANAVSMTSSPIGFSSIQSASNATGTIAGIPFSSASNAVSGVLSNVTLNLLSTSPSGTTQTVTVSANTQSAVNAVQSFVSAYNTALSLIATETAYTPGSAAPGSTTTATGTAGPLLGDIAIETLQQKLQSITGQSTGGSGMYTLLSQIGVTANVDGSLAVNSSTLSNAVQQNTGAVQSLFSGSSGIGTQLNNILAAAVGGLGIGGSIDAETNALQSQITHMNNQLADLSTLSSQLTAQYNAEFNAMDSIVASYKSTSNLLTQLYAPKNNSSSGSG